MGNLVALRRVLLALPLLTSSVAQADAQAVPPPENIKSQVELDKAIAALDIR